MSDFDPFAPPKTVPHADHAALRRRLIHVSQKREILIGTLKWIEQNHHECDGEFNDRVKAAIREGSE